MRIEYLNAMKISYPQHDKRRGCETISTVFSKIKNSIHTVK